jgi:hypothetical protein
VGGYPIVPSRRRWHSDCAGSGAAGSSTRGRLSSAAPAQGRVKLDSLSLYSLVCMGSQKAKPPRERGPAWTGGVLRARLDYFTFSGLYPSLKWYSTNTQPLSRQV